MREIKEICICRIDKIGDLIMTTPILRSIRKEFPNSKITLLVSPINSKVLKESELIDEMIVIDKKNKLWKNDEILKKIRKRSFDLFVNFSPTNLSYFLCFFSNSKNKSTLILKSRYKNKFSKIFIHFLSKIFCNHIILVNRNKLFKNNLDFHQTKMMYALIEKTFNRSFNYENLEIPILPNTKIKLNYLSKKIITLHLSNRWLNKYYTLENLKILIENINLNQDYLIFLTTEKYEDKNFYKLTNNYNKLQILDFVNLEQFNKKISKTNIFVLDYFKYEDWLYIINNSDRIITPEGGCVHVAAGLNKYVTVIYDNDNLPEYIYTEYMPWKTKHQKLVFGISEINKEILTDLN